jgi:hypothetical protein
MALPALSLRLTRFSGHLSFFLRCLGHLAAKNLALRQQLADLHFKTTPAPHMGPVGRLL